MRIKSARFYQAVYLDGKMITHMNLENVKGSGAISQNVKLSLIDNMGVLMESDTDAVIVSFANCSAIQLYKDQPAKDVKKATSKGA